VLEFYGRVSGQDVKKNDGQDYKQGYEQPHSEVKWSEERHPMGKR